MNIHVRRDVDGIEIGYTRSCEHPDQLDDLVLAEDNEPGRILELVVEEE